MIEKQEGIKIQPQVANEPGKFTRDIIWLTIAQLFVSVILGIVTLPALTKSYNSEIYGVWIQVSVTVGLISPLLSLQLGLAVVRFLAGEENKAKRNRAFGAMLCAIMIFAVIVAIFGILLSPQISTLLFASPEYTTYVGLIILWTFFNSLYNFFLSYLRVRGKMREISICYVGFTIMQMVTIVGLSKSGYSLESIITCMIILQFIFSVGILSWIVKDIGFPIPNLSGLKAYLIYSIPQMPVVVLLWVISLSDRYFITHFISLSQDGIYSSSNTVAGLTALFYAPISYVLFPMVSKLWEQQRLAEVKMYFEYSIRLFLTFAVPGAIGISILSQALLKLLTTSEFLAGEYLVLLLAFGGVFLGIYQIYINLILLGKQAKLLPLMTAVAAIASVILNIILIPLLGITGAAISNFASYLILAAIVMVRAKKTMIIEYNLRYYGKVILSSLGMMLCLIFLKADTIWSIILAAIIGSIVFVLGLLFLKAFSQQDFQFIKRTINNLVPNYLRRKG
jgi:O-antigen/teichoic acid export membrane protein